MSLSCPLEWKLYERKGFAWLWHSPKPWPLPQQAGKVTSSLPSLHPLISTTYLLCSSLRFIMKSNDWQWTRGDVRKGCRKRMRYKHLDVNAWPREGTRWFDFYEWRWASDSTGHSTQVLKSDICFPVLTRGHAARPSAWPRNQGGTARSQGLIQ